MKQGGYGITDKNKKQPLTWVFRLLGTVAETFAPLPASAGPCPPAPNMAFPNSNASPFCGGGGGGGGGKVEKGGGTSTSWIPVESWEP